MGDAGSSSATLGMVEVGSVAETLLGNELNDALREQTLTLGQLRRAIAVKLSTTESRLKEDTAIKALLKEKMIAMHQLETQRTAAAAAKALQGGNNATSDAPARSSSKTHDAPTADTAPAPAPKAGDDPPASSTTVRVVQPPRPPSPAI